MPSKVFTDFSDYFSKQLKESQKRATKGIINDIAIKEEDHDDDEEMGNLVASPSTGYTKSTYSRKKSNILISET